MNGISIRPHLANTRSCPPIFICSPALTCLRLMVAIRIVAGQLGSRVRWRAVLVRATKWGVRRTGRFMEYSPYFTIGDAVAGLGIFLLIPQFLKPVYFFRLRVIGIGLRTLYAAAALGFMCVLMAAFLPHLPSLQPAVLRDPLVWVTIDGLPYAT